MRKEASGATMPPICGQTALPPFCLGRSETGNCACISGRRRGTSRIIMTPGSLCKNSCNCISPITLTYRMAIMHGMSGKRNSTMRCSGCSGDERDLPSAKSRDLVGNGGAGGEASLPGFGVSPISLFPKLLVDYALGAFIAGVETHYDARKAEGHRCTSVHCAQSGLRALQIARP